MAKKMKRSTTEDESSSSSGSSTDDVSREETARHRRRRSQTRRNTRKKEFQGKEIIKFLAEIKEEMCKQSKQATESKEEMCMRLEKLRMEMRIQSNQATESKEEICKQLEKVKEDNQEMRKQLTEILTYLHKQRDLHTNGSSGDNSDAPRSQSNQVQPPRYRLVLIPGVTDKIEKGQIINISAALVDGSNDQIVENGPLASATVELVVLNAEFNQHNNQYNWSREDFERNIKKVQERDSATGDVDQSLKSIVSNGRFNLVHGARCHNGSTIFMNSGNKKVRLGVMVVSPTEERVLEGLSNPFFVRGHDRPSRQNNLCRNMSNTRKQPQLRGNTTTFSSGLNVTGEQPELPFIITSTATPSTEPSTNQDQHASIQQYQLEDPCYLPIMNYQNGTPFNTNQTAFPVHLVWNTPIVEPSKHSWNLLDELTAMPEHFGSLTITSKEPLEPENDEVQPLKRKLHSKYRLCFVNKVCEAYYLWDQIKADDENLLKVALFDEDNTMITSGPLSSASVGVVALHGDFNGDDQDYWNSEEFSRYVLCPQPGEAASSILGGDRVFVLAGGEACLGDAFFKKTSFCARTGKFKMGVMLASAQEERVQEGISEPFRVMDNPVKELYAKDEPTRKGFDPAAATLQFPGNTVTEAIQQQESTPQNQCSHLKTSSGAQATSSVPAIVVGAQHTAATTILLDLGVPETTATQQKQHLLHSAAGARTSFLAISKASSFTASGTTKNDVDDSSWATMLVPSIQTCSFLQRCFLCNRELSMDTTIYMYRGDTAFCSKYCRGWHMKKDDSSTIDSAGVTAPDSFHRSGSCYNATSRGSFFLECRQVQG